MRERERRERERDVGVGGLQGRENLENSAHAANAPGIACV